MSRNEKGEVQSLVHNLQWKEEEYHLIWGEANENTDLTTYQLHVKSGGSHPVLNVIIKHYDLVPISTGSPDSPPPPPTKKWLLFQPFQKEKEKGKRKEKKNPKMAVINKASTRRLTNSILAVKRWKIARERERQREEKKLELCVMSAKECFVCSMLGCRPETQRLRFCSSPLFFLSVHHSRWM